MLLHVDDGRHCAMPQTDPETGCCYFHAKRERQRLNAETIGLNISNFLHADMRTACDLSVIFGLLFAGTACGYISPRLPTPSPASVSLCSKFNP